MICPHMSGPVAYPDSHDPSVIITEIFVANCEGDRCPHFYWNYVDGKRKDRCSFGEGIQA